MVIDVFWLLVACVVGRVEVLIEVGDPFVFIPKVSRVLIVAWHSSAFPIICLDCGQCNLP